MVLRFALTGALAIALAATSGVAAAQAQAEIGRYQVVVINDKAGHLAVLVDSVTGRSWILNARNDRRWSDLNYGEMQGGRLMLVPAPCTQDNPTCYFSSPKSAGEAPAAQKPAAGAEVQ
jgi:hypothetical protein